MRRDDMRRSFGQFRFSPRPKIDRIGPQVLRGPARSTTSRTAPGRLETRDSDGEFAHRVPEQRSLSASACTDSYEFLPRPFDIAPGVTLPVGGYDFDDRARQLQLWASSGKLRGKCRAGSRLVLQRPPDGVSFSRGRDERLDRSCRSSRRSRSTGSILPEGSFTTHLVGSRVTYTMTPLMFASALVQYNSSSHAVSANVRLRWEIPSRQRAVRRLQRGARHARPPLPRSREPGLHRQDQSPVSTVSRFHTQTTEARRTRSLWKI